MTTINASGRAATVAEFNKMINNITDDNLQHSEFGNILNNALVIGAKVTNGVEKIKEYAAIFKLNKLSKHDALIALHGSVPKSEHDLTSAERVLNYLLAHDPQAKSLVAGNVVQRTGVSYMAILEKVLISFFKTRNVSDHFSWQDLRLVCAEEFALKDNEITSVHSSFRQKCLNKKLLARVENTERNHSLWHLTEAGQTKFGPSK